MMYIVFNDYFFKNMDGRSFVFKCIVTVPNHPISFNYHKVRGEASHIHATVCVCRQMAHEPLTAAP
ncbi:hypothetical protein TSMEX_011839 [Taenia solium]|eukprot:TsM_000551100 transcript=TsM_000551100 gene=TsM_000551100